MNTFEVRACFTLKVQAGEQEGKHEYSFNYILKMLNTNMLVVSNIWSLLYIVLHYDYPDNVHLKPVVDICNLMDKLLLVNHCTLKHIMVIRYLKLLLYIDRQNVCCFSVIIQQNEL